MGMASRAMVFDRLDIRFTRLHVIAAAGAVLAAALGVFIFQIVFSRNLMLPAGVHLGGDFVAFWSAARAVVEGHAGELYDPVFFEGWLQTTFPADEPYGLYWRYPPTYFFFILPFAFTPFAPAYAAWTGGGLIAYAAVCRAAGLSWLQLFVILAAPVVFNAAITGQNGFITASLLAGATLLPDKRPAAAGLCAALLTAKPQLGLLIPVAYAAGGCWRAFGWAAVGSVLLALASLAVFGVEAWQRFPEGTALITERLGEGVMPLFKTPTAFAALMLAGAPAPLALSVHGTLAFAVAATVAAVWRRVRDVELRAAALCVGVFFISPYVYYYELVIAALPMALLAKRAAASGWLKFEQLSFAGLFLIPLLLPGDPHRSGFHLGFAVTLLALFVVLRRASPAALFSLRTSGRIDLAAAQLSGKSDRGA